MAAGDEGSVFLTRDGGENWGSPGFSLNRGEEVIVAAFSADGKTGVVAGSRGSVFLTRDGGGNWSPRNFPLDRVEGVTVAAISTDDKTSIIYRIITSASPTRGSGENWSISLDYGERITAAVFSADGKIGVVAGSRGSVFLTKDRGENWGSPDLSLNRGEWITAAAFSTNGETGVIVGDEGSVFLTRDGGENWMSTKGEKLGSSDSFPSLVWITNGSFLAKMENGVQYILKSYPGLTKMSLVDIHKEMGKDRILSNSEIYTNIGAFLYRINSSIDVGDNGGETESYDNGGLLGLDNITAMRIVTLFALFFIVHVLVRLHQYRLRLAAFWDARADAVLLARSFSYRRAETFDDLVVALAPDAYDFKPSPKLGHEGVMNLAGQLLRRESRKS